MDLGQGGTCASGAKYLLFRLIGGQEPESIRIVI